MSYKKKAIIYSLLILLGILLPLFLMNSYHVYQLTVVYVYAIAILGLNLLVGYNGQISLGHCAFYAIGAYTTAIMVTRWEIEYIWTLPIATIISFLSGLLIGFPAARLHNISLTVATFGLAVSTPQLLKYFDNWTNGVEGINLTSIEVPWNLPIDKDAWLYYLVFAIMILLFVLSHNLLQSRIGRALIAIRDNPLAAQSMGINLLLYKTLTFGVSAAYTGLAGALGAIVVQYIAPDFFFLTLSFTFIVGVVMGGAASILGSIPGAFFAVFIPSFTDEISKAAPSLIFGAIIILCIYTMPKGFAGIIKRIKFFQN